MLRRLRVKFVIIMMLIVTLMLSVIFGLFYYFTKVDLEQSSLTMMQSIAMNPFRMEVPGTANPEVQLPYFMVQVDEDGELVGTSGGYYDLSDEELIQKLVDACLETEEYVGVLREYNLRYYKEDLPEFSILVFADISSENATLGNLVRSCAIIGFLSLLAFLAVSIILARWAVRPVSFAWEQQRRFVADASHELKTPLTVISTNAEIVMSPEYDAQTRQQCAEGIVAMSVQMRKLVEGLLNLARADKGQEDMLTERIDLSELLKEAVLPFEAVFFEQGLEFVTGIHSRIYVKGSTQYLEQMTGILLDNAQKYALHTEPVYMKLWPVGRSRCRLTLSNASQPLTANQCKDIFKRFYRLDESRSAGGSYGLGLSIAERIVVAHKGRIWANYEDGILTFNVELPMCK